VGTGCLWSSLYLPAGTELADSKHRLFDVAEGRPDQNGRVLSGTDTNLREAGRVPSGVGYQCERVNWLVREAFPDSALETLAQAFGRSMVDLIKEHGILHWDFTQTHIPISPLWADGVEQLVAIPGNTTWYMILRFGPGAPKLDHAHVVRVLLSGKFRTQIEFG
jgi:hypothetical protein